MSDSPSTTIRRKRDRQRFDPETLDGILEAGLVAHVGFVRDGHPIVLPYLYGVGDLGDGLGRQLLLHGSSGGGLFLDAGASGVPVSVAVTHIDSIVVATSTFESSADYRSAVVFGDATVVPDALKAEALRLVSEHLLPGRSAEARAMTRRELAQTLVLRVALDRVSVKVRSGGIADAPDDGEDHSVWSGVVPIALRAGPPVSSVATTASVPPSARALVARLNG